MARAENNGDLVDDQRLSPRQRTEKAGTLKAGAGAVNRKTPAAETFTHHVDGRFSRAFAEPGTGHFAS